MSYLKRLCNDANYNSILYQVVIVANFAKKVYLFIKNLYLQQLQIQIFEIREIVFLYLIISNVTNVVHNNTQMYLFLYFCFALWSVGMMLFFWWQQNLALSHLYTSSDRVFRLAPTFFPQQQIVFYYLLDRFFGKLNDEEDMGFLVSNGRL